MHVVHLQEGLAHRGYGTRLIAGDISPGEGDMEYFARQHGVEITRVPHLGREMNPSHDLRTLLTLYRIFKRDRPHVVHTHTAKAGALGRLAAAMAGVPLRIHTFHGHVLGGGYFSPHKTRFFLELERILARLTHRIVVLTPGQRRELVQDFQIAPPEKFAVVPLGLDLQRFAAAQAHQDPVALKLRLGLDPGVRLVGIVGRLVPVKNHQLLLRALLHLPSHIHLAVVGGGELEGELHRLAEELGVDDRVHWLGWQEDLTQLYPGLDALALVSLDEGTPVAVLEALAARVPVAARSVGGVSEILRRGEFGTLISEATATAVGAGITTALESPLSSAQRENASRYVVESFGVDRLVEDVDRLYRSEWRRVVGGELP